jgi:hypothetical protein
MANGKKKYGDWRDTVDPGKVDTFNQTKAIIKKNWSLTKPGRVVAPVKPAKLRHILLNKEDMMPSFTDLRKKKGDPDLRRDYAKKDGVAYINQKAAQYQGTPLPAGAPCPKCKGKNTVKKGETWFCNDCYAVWQ